MYPRKSPELLDIRISKGGVVNAARNAKAKETV
ncbi:hypothetical protein BFJ65_g5406 [Fusarium oxysporum f. sp. cepae]|uniref:Uncharacterized protein n=1 Tax=Fusarium oxysporum f. sp. cepae TaxID=396571 RepID=A0A3L6NVS9_FUSOX|nr:hypothetical protein BFJ65_g5406 [Fusarium oxysporum f. sp. cepae]